MVRTGIGLTLAAVLLAGGCGGSPEPPRERRADTAPAPRWPGTVAYSAEATARTGLDIYIRSGERAPRRLTRRRVNEFSPSWAPSGRWLAYRVNPPRGDEGDIWTMRG